MLLITSQITLSKDGSTLAVTGLIASSQSIGVVRVYRKNQNNVWVQIGQFSGSGEFDYFGRSVSLSSNGSIVAIGTNKNYVKVFHYNDLGYWDDQRIDGIDNNGLIVDSFGMCVSISNEGKVLAVSSRERIFIYESNSDGEWTVFGKTLLVESLVEEQGELIHQTVKLSGDGRTVAIQDKNPHFEVTIYKFNDSWKKIGNGIRQVVTNEALDMSDDGSIVAMGNFDSFGGSIRVFRLQNDKNHSDWFQLGQDITMSEKSSIFTFSLSGNGKRLAVSMNTHEIDKRGNSGEVQVFTLFRNEWVQVGNTITGHLDSDIFGEGLSLSSDGLKVAVACPPYNYKNGPFEYRESNGHVMMYELIGSIPTAPPSLLPTSSFVSSDDKPPSFVNKTTPSLSPTNSSSLRTSLRPSTAPVSPPQPSQSPSTQTKLSKQSQRPTSNLRAPTTTTSNQSDDNDDANSSAASSSNHCVLALVFIFSLIPIVL